MLEKLQASDFSSHVGETFEVRLSSSDSAKAELTEVSEYERPSGPADAPELKHRHPFSILFKIERDPPLPQDIYTVRHTAMAAMDLFLVPIGRDADGFLYEAVFN